MHRHAHSLLGDSSPTRRHGRRGWLAQLAGWLSGLGRRAGARERGGGPALPARLLRGQLARAYLSADHERDHPRAAAAATAQLESAAAAGLWAAADAWGHRALWHFEQAGMTLHAARAARRIADARLLSGDATGSRRYYAEAISEARDIGAEREEGLAALGLARAHLEMRRVSEARRLAQIAVDLLERGGAPVAEIAAARALRGTEKRVGVEGTDG